MMMTGVRVCRWALRAITVGTRRVAAIPDDELAHYCSLFCPGHGTLLQVLNKERYICGSMITRGTTPCYCFLC
jgi:hypothetical protein